MYSLPELKPPILNSSSLWASTKEELTDLYNCPHTGAITVRTSLLKGFNHDDSIHQHCFFNSTTSEPSLDSANSSLNSVGYSPTTLAQYIDIIDDIVTSSQNRRKPVIFSVTGTATEVGKCLTLLSTSPCKTYAMMEINMSCPNIHDKPPAAHSIVKIRNYLTTLPKDVNLPVGLKMPPFTDSMQFVAVIQALSDMESYPISFITSTNTLGSSLILDPATLQPVLNSSSGLGTGGLAGAALHPLALGNVRTFRSMLDAVGLRDVVIIGTGGVSDHAGYLRMKKVGAWAVGIGTALGLEGVDVFEKILKE